MEKSKKENADGLTSKLDRYIKAKLAEKEAKKESDALRPEVDKYFIDHTEYVSGNKEIIKKESVRTAIDEDALLTWAKAHHPEVTKTVVAIDEGKLDELVYNDRQVAGEVAKYTTQKKITAYYVKEK